MAKQKRVILCGYYGLGNGGDEALLVTLLQLLPAHLSPVVLSGNPAATARQYGVQTVARKSPWALLRTLASADALVWGGGSLMQDATSLQNPIYYGGLMLLAQLLGCTTLAWAQGIGPLRHPFSRWLARRALQGCAGVSVRDGASAALLDGWGIAHHQAPDPVWVLDAAPAHDTMDLLAPRVAVALRPHPWLTPQRIGLLGEGLAQFQAQAQVGLVLVAFQPQKDRPLAETIQGYLSGPSQICEFADPQRLKGLFQEVQLAIAMRLHAVIMAAAEGCSCFALSYDPKVQQVMASLNLPGWDLDPAIADALPPTATAVAQTWLQIYRQNQALSPAQVQAQQQQALVHQRLLQQHL